MSKKTHTWKIGEYCAGGIITVEITGKVISVIQKEWDHSKGTRRSSDQSQAKELNRATGTADDSNIERKLSDFLNEITTSYHADQVIQWIKSKVELKADTFW